MVLEVKQPVHIECWTLSDGFCILKGFVKERTTTEVVVTITDRIKLSGTVVRVSEFSERRIPIDWESHFEIPLIDRIATIKQETEQMFSWFSDHVNGLT